jgi:protein-disulfide isomerase
MIMRRLSRSPGSVRSRAAAASIAAALAISMAAACGYAPEGAAPPAEVVAAAGDRLDPESAPARDARTAADAPMAEGAGCDVPPEGCDCNPSAAQESPEALVENAPIEDIRIGTSPARGPADAPVTLVVFSDFECPFCAKVSGVLEQIEQEYPGKLRIAFKHRPLPFHTEARTAARAAIAAQAQGRFWEYHDALFQRAREGLDQDVLERRAAELGLDVARFGQDMRSPEVEAALAADAEDAARLKIAGTPTLFVNGRRVVGAQPIEVLRAAVDRALADR